MRRARRIVANAESVMRLCYPKQTHVRAVRHALALANAAPHVRGVRLPACAVDGAVHVFEAAETSVRGDQVHE